MAVALARLGHDFMIRDGDARQILQHSQHLDDVARTIAERATVLEVEGSREGPIEQTAVYGKVRSLLDDWFTYAEELHQDRVDLNYTADGPSTTRKLLHEMLDPKLVNLSPVRRQFKAPRSMRDVEPSVAILPRRFKAPKAPIKVKNEVTVSALRQSQLVTTYGPGAMIDLPWFAAVVGGLDFWDKGARISEPRLEAKAAQALGGVAVDLAAPLRQRQAARRDDDEGRDRLEVPQVVDHPGDQATGRTRRADLPDPHARPRGPPGREDRPV